jgi:hypothetical protein
MTAESPVPNSLDYDDDGDDVEIVVEIERAFGVKITDAEAKSIVQVGQLYDVLESKLGPTSGEKCATAMTFYRLRQAIRQDASLVSLDPDTRLADIRDGNPKRAFRKMEERCGLTLPTLLIGWMGMVGFALPLIVVLGGLLGNEFLNELVDFGPKPGLAWTLIAAGICCIGAGLVWADPMKLSKRLSTLGDLATVTAALNYGDLVQKGARHSRDELWDALTEVLSAFRATLAPREIHRGTYLLQVTYEEARKSGAFDYHVS